MHMSRDAAVSAAMVVISLLFVGYIAYERLPDVLRAERVENPLPLYPLPIDDAPVRGSRQARVAVIVYSDFVCPACGRLALLTMPELDARYVDTGKALVAHRHFPGGTFRPLAFRAAEGAACAGEQGKFWEMHDAIFNARAEGREYGRSDASILESDLRAFAKAMALDGPRFESCLGGRQSRAVFTDAGSGIALGINSTPAVLVGLVQPDGRVQVRRHFIDQLIAAADSPAPAR
jgi:protein-disulfide isomerase